MHYAAYAGSNNDDEDYSVSCEDTWHGRWKKCGSCFFQPPSNIIQTHSNIIQTHSNVIQNLKPQKISVKKVCLLFPTEILLNALAQNWHRCGFPCGIGFLCGRSWVWEPTAPFCIRRSSKDGLVMNMNIIEYPSHDSHPPKQWIHLKCRKALTSDLFVLNYDQLLWLEIHPVSYMATTQRG